MTAMQLYLLAMLACLLQGVMLPFYGKAFFTPRYGAGVTLGNVLAGYLVICCCHLTSNTLFVFAITAVINTILLLLLYRDTLRVLLFHALMLTAVAGVSELLCLGVLRVIGSSGKGDAVLAEWYAMLLGRLIYFLLVVIICRVFGRRNVESRDKGFWWLTVMPLASLACVSVLLYAMRAFEFNKTMQLTGSVGAVLLLAANVTVFMIYRRALENAQRLSELTVMRQKDELDRQYYRLLEQSQTSLRILSHDMKNHFAAIKGLATPEEVSAYIDKLYPQLEAFEALGSSSNKMLDLVIGKCREQCRSSRISFSFDVKGTSLGYIDDADLSAMLSNLLDNAVEAAQGSTAKTVSLSVFSKNEQCDAVVVQNSCDDAPKTKNGRLITSKGDSTLHGVGLKSVLAAAQKYNALFDWDYDSAQKQFTATLVIPKEVKQNEENQ